VTVLKFCRLPWLYSRLQRVAQVRQRQLSYLLRFRVTLFWPCEAPGYCFASAVYSVVVCLSVWPSQIGVLSKRLILWLLQIYTVTSSILDHAARSAQGQSLPYHNVTPDNRWLTPEAIATKRRRRQLEKKWKKHQLEESVWYTAKPVGLLTRPSESEREFYSNPVSTGMGDVSRFDSRRRHFIWVCNQPPRSTQIFEVDKLSSKL